MKDTFLTNKTDFSFLDKLKDNLKRCNSFCFSVSFIKKAGLVLIEREIEDALDRGVRGKIITSTYQNFTDIPSLELFLSWTKEYENFECHLDFECFGEDGFHSKGYLFEYDNEVELLVGSSNITRFALLNNIEWNISLTTSDSLKSYTDALLEFNNLWEKTLQLDSKLIDLYRLRLDYALERWDMDYINPNVLAVNPNSMQRKALKEIRRYRDTGVNKALVISATGSGKTYLAAFDARNFNAKRLLYVVHRDFVLKEARETFMNVFGAERTYGLYTGETSQLECDFIFATTSMLSRHLNIFNPKEFDYIIYDEVHHIVADSGHKIFEYFNPEFMLGLTATPERMDNKDVFGLFDQNIPYELRLRDAILNDLVVPFHYYGIRTVLADYKEKDRSIVAKQIGGIENVEFICDQIESHRKENEKLKCIAFCTTIKHCEMMAEQFRQLGYHSIALTGVNDLGQRIRAFNDLQDDSKELEIICSVDILNEGVDIPQINMVLFLRPTESQTIFLQQLGRGLRKYPGKEYVTVLDFIGNNYDRSVQIALALGSLGKTVYTEKAYLKSLINDNFASLNIPGLIIDIDELSKEEIIHYIDNTNFNKTAILKKDYENFKDYIKSDLYPSHMDYLNYDISPDLIRFLKSRINNIKNKSYYSFLKKIGEENIPIFSDNENDVLDNLEELLPLIRIDEFAIIKQLIDEHQYDKNSLLQNYPSTSVESLDHAYNILMKKNILNNPEVDFTRLRDDLKEYIEDTLEYGMTRYSNEFGDFKGYYKQYANYYSEQITMAIRKEGIWQLGTYFNVIEKGDTFIFAGLKKGDVGRLNYKDKFINSSVFQWESRNDTTINNSEGKKLIDTKKVYLFVRKMKEEDGVTLPFTFLGTGVFTNMRNSYTEENGKIHDTLLFDIVLDNPVPKDYHLDFEIVD